MTDIMSKSKWYLAVLFLITVVMAGSAHGSAFWEEVSTNMHIQQLNMNKDATKTIRLKADIPAGKTLRAYNFAIAYDGTNVSLESVVAASTGTILAPSVINPASYPSTTGSLIINCFSVNGVAGGADGVTAAFVDVTLRGKAIGSSNVTITVNSYGFDETNQFKPTPETLAVTVVNANAPVVSIPANIRATPGGTVIVPINITGVAGTGIGGYMTRLDYDIAVLSSPTIITTGTLSAGKIIHSVAPPSDGIGKLSAGIGFGFSPAADGILFKVQFNVSANFTGISPITIVSDNVKSVLFDAGFSQIMAAFTDGSLLAVGKVENIVFSPLVTLPQFIKLNEDLTASWSAPADDTLVMNYLLKFSTSNVPLTDQQFNGTINDFSVPKTQLSKTIPKSFFDTYDSDQLRYLHIKTQYVPNVYSDDVVVGPIRIDNTAPTFAINAPSVATTKSGPVTYTVTYTGADTIPLTDADVTVIPTDTATGTATVSGTGNTERTVTISNITGDGKLGISIAAGAASDMAGNVASAAGPSATFTVDNTIPVVSSGGNQTKNGEFTQTGTATDASGMTYSWSMQAGPGTVTFGMANSLSTTISASVDGSYTIRFTATDAAGNSSYNDMTLVWDTTRPTVVIGSPSAMITKSGPVTYTVIYTGADDVALADANVTLTKTGTANGTVVVSGTGNTERTVTISNITGDGTLGVSIAAGTASDTVGNLASAAEPSATFMVDNTAPTSGDSAGVIQLPKTGQKICYNEGGTAISCSGTGQDGEVQTGVVWPDPRFIDNGDQMVTDKLTGLIWTKDGNVPGPSACGPAGVTKNWQEALSYVVCLNTNNYLGYNDWRLPNVIEIQSIVNAGQSNPAQWLNQQGFINVQESQDVNNALSYYWSSSTVEGSADYAWASILSIGYSTFDSKSDGHNVLPVRGGQCRASGISTICLPKSGQTIKYAAGDDADLQKGTTSPSTRFIDNSDQTVTDNLTGLIWTKNANTPGPSPCSPGITQTWQAAFDHVSCLNTNNYLGYHDWRLPNKNELTSLLDYSKYSPSIPAGHPFTGVPGQYWTSTPAGAGTTKAWYVHMVFAAAYDSNMVQNKFSIWPVRGGLSAISINSGASTTKSTSVTLTLSSADAHGVVGMVLSNNAAFAGATEKAYATTMTWTLPDGDGPKTVYVKFKDTAGNWSDPYTSSITLDTVLTIGLGTPSVTTAKSGPVTYTVTYTGADTITLTDADVTVIPTDTATGTATVSGTGNTERTVTISNITGDGKLGISIAAGTASDMAGNVASAAGPSATFTVDNTIPVVSSGGNQTKNGEFTQTGTATDASGMTYSWSMQAGPGTVTFGMANSLSTTISASVDGSYTIRFTATDAAGNSSYNDMTLVWDTTRPTVVIGSPSAMITKSGPVTYTVIYTGADDVALADANVTLTKTGTANGTVVVSGTGNTERTVTISNITGDGTLGVSIAAGTASDTVGNLASAAEPSATFMVDNTAPVVTNDSPADGSSNIGVNAVVIATFNESIDAATISNSTVTVRTGTSIAQGTVSYDPNMKSAIFTPSSAFVANKTYTATVTSGIQDLSGNHLASDYSWMFSTVITGDINGDESVDMIDAILALRFLSGIQTEGIRSDYSSSGVDVNGNGRLGTEEILYILQSVAGLR